jgi:hypothetical protein
MSTPKGSNLARDMAFFAWTAALARQVARRLSRLALEVFFLGTAIMVTNKLRFEFKTIL